MRVEQKRNWYVQFKHSEVRLVGTWRDVIKLCTEKDEIPVLTSSRPVFIPASAVRLH